MLVYTLIFSLEYYLCVSSVIRRYVDFNLLPQGRPITVSWLLSKGSDENG